MPSRLQIWLGTLRRFRFRVPGKLSGWNNPLTRDLNKSLPSQKQNSTHSDSEARVPDLFKRRDQIFLELEAQRLQIHIPPPRIYHDLLDAVAKVGHVEERIGYTFKNKMLCVEALKLTGSNIPLYFKGKTYYVDKNVRLALLGDRVLGLALCDVWYKTGNTRADYSAMLLESETRSVLHTRGQALGIKENLIWDPSLFNVIGANQVPEAVEAILGAVYLDSGESMDTVKKVTTKAALDTHKLLKADAQSQDVHKQKEVNDLRKTKSVVVAKRVSTQVPKETLKEKIRRKKERSRLAREREKEQERVKTEQERVKKEQEQVKTEQEQVKTEQERVKAEQERVKTEQKQAKSEQKQVKTEQKQVKAEQERVKAEQKQVETEQKRLETEQKQLKTDKENSQSLNEEAQSESRNPALKSKSKRRAVAAANRLSKEGDLLDDGYGPTADSGRQLPPVSRSEDEEKVDSPYEPDAQGPQTSPPEKETDCKAKGQPKQTNAMDTHLEQDKLPVEELAGLPFFHQIGRLRWWQEAVEKRDILLKKGINVDTMVLYKATKVKLLGKKTPVEMLPQKDEVAPLESIEDKTQAPASLLPESAPTSAKYAESIHENWVPASIKNEQERHPTIGSDETDPATSSALAPTQELSDSFENTGLPTLDASHQKTSAAHESAENKTVTSPDPVSVQKFSSSPEQPSPTKSTRVASNNRKKALQELSSHLEDTSFVNASATNSSDEDGEKAVSTEDVGQLERDILKSHRDIWQANETAGSSLKPTKRPYNRVANVRRSRNSRILAEQLTGSAPLTRGATREEYAGSGDSLQGVPRNQDSNAIPFVRYDYYGSGIERSKVNTTEHDSEAPDTPDTPQSEPEKKQTLYTPAFPQLSKRSKFRIRLDNFSYPWSESTSNTYIKKELGSKHRKTFY